MQFAIFFRMILNVLLNFCHPILYIALTPLGPNMLGIRDGSLEGLGHQAGGFARNGREHGLRIGNGHALNLARDFTHFLRRHPDIAGGGGDVHPLVISRFT